MKRTLKSLTTEELRELTTALGKASKENALLIKMYLNGNSAEHLESFKDKIDKLFGNLDRLDFRAVRHNLTIFRNFSVKPEEVAELYVYAMETGNDITMSYGDIGDRYYTSMENIYRDACEQVAALPKSSIADNLKQRLKKTVEITSGIGWGYHDTLGDLFYENFPECSNEIDGK